jgi:nucleoside-diphosphate-sugar epimerase
LGLLGNDQAIGHAFHITTDEVLTWNQIYTTIAEAVGVEPKLVHISSADIIRVSPEHYGGLLGDKAWSVVFDNSKIKTWVPGFRCEIPFRAGICRTVAQLEADKSRQRIDDAVNRDLDHILAACGHAGA